MLVTIIYDSGYGHTEKQAEAVAEGVRCVPCVDQLNSLITVALFAAQHGMIWAGLDLFPGKTAEEPNRIGGWLGAMAQSDYVPPDQSPTASDLETAAHLGQRVTETIRRFQPT